MPGAEDHIVRKPRVPSGAQRQPLCCISLAEDAVQGTATGLDIPFPWPQAKRLCLPRWAHLWAVLPGKHRAWALHTPW